MLGVNLGVDKCYAEPKPEIVIPPMELTSRYLENPTGSGTLFNFAQRDPNSELRAIRAIRAMDPSEKTTCKIPRPAEVERSWVKLG